LNRFAFTLVALAIWATNGAALAQSTNKLAHNLLWQKADLLSFVRDDGKGFIGIHRAAITFTHWPEYRQMLGGYFNSHPWGQFNAPLVVEDSKFPGMSSSSS
jgi:type 1 glutamine amidotransferase